MRSKLIKLFVVLVLILAVMDLVLGIIHLVECAHAGTVHSPIDPAISDIKPPRTQIKRAEGTDVVPAAASGGGQTNLAPIIGGTSGAITLLLFFLIYLYRSRRAVTIVPYPYDAERATGREGDRYTPVRGVRYLSGGGGPKTIPKYKPHLHADAPPMYSSRPRYPPAPNVRGQPPLRRPPAAIVPNGRDERYLRGNGLRPRAGGGGGHPMVERGHPPVIGRGGHGGGGNVASATGRNKRVSFAAATTVRQPARAWRG